jgi:hypothetical protein
VNSAPTASQSPGTGAKASRRCVYTALFGGYEKLNDQPAALQSNIPFLCFTDDTTLQSETWQIRVVTPIFTMDPARSQRDFKLRPHVHLPEFDVSLYIDNAVVLSQPPEPVFERYPPTSGFCLAKHSFRDTVLSEFMEVISRGFDDPNRVFEQLNHYTLECPEVLEERPYWGGILLRDHRRPEVQAMLDVWYANVFRYSRRDQLSANAAFRQVGLTPDVMDIDNYSSWFHTWPHTPGRDRLKGALNPTISFSPPIARVRQLERQLAEQERQHEETMTSEAWRLGKGLRDSAKRHPLLVKPALGVLGRLFRIPLDR